eukprot:COSAG01_NODE_2033_length_8583_cov_10.425389_1_plen_24_part_10
MIPTQDAALIPAILYYTALLLTVH